MKPGVYGMAFDVINGKLENGRELKEENIVDSIPILMGWICPVCGRGLSPATADCDCHATEFVNEQGELLAKALESPGFMKWLDEAMGAKKSALEWQAKERESEFEIAWQRLIDRFDGDKSDPPTPDTEIVERIEQHLDDREKTIDENLKLRNEANELSNYVLKLERGTQELKDKLESVENVVTDLKREHIAIGKLAPAMKAIRELASLIGFETPPTTDDIEKVAKLAKSEIIEGREVRREQDRMIADLKREPLCDNCEASEY